MKLMRAATAVVATAIAIATSIVLLTASPVGATAEPFVQRTGTELTLGGQQWRFVGFNSFDAAGVPSPSVSTLPADYRYNCANGYTPTQLSSLLQDAKADGATAVRANFFQSYSDPTSSNPWARFDALLTSAQQVGVKIIPMLVNGDSDCEAGGGADQPFQHGKTLSWFESGYKSAGDGIGDGYQMSFRDYAQAIATHYANSSLGSTIAFWQVANEPHPGGQNDSTTCSDPADEPAAAQALRAFADDVGGVIKQADPHHLISLGTAGGSECGISGTQSDGTPNYQYVNGSPAVDLCEFHDYGNYWNSVVNEPLADPWADSTLHLSDRIKECGSLDKAFFVGESGIPVDVSDSGHSKPVGPNGAPAVDATSLQLRAGFFTQRMTWAFQRGVAGYLVWSKSQWDSAAPGDIFNVGPGAATADDPQPTFEPSNRVTASFASSFGALTPGFSRSDFERGDLDGWNTWWGSPNLSLTTTRSEAWTGEWSLDMNLQGGASNVAASTAVPSGTEPVPGTTITYYVYEPAAAAGTNLSVTPAVNDGNWTFQGGSSTTLSPGWNVVSWTTPQTLVAPVHSLGLEVNNPGGYTGSIYLDDVTWALSGTVRSNFEDGTTGGWSVAWGAPQLAVSNSSARAWKGNRSLAVKLSGSQPSYNAVNYSLAAPNDLTSDKTVTFHVYVPSSAPTSLAIVPTSSNRAWQLGFGPQESLTPGRWNIVQYNVPAGVPTPLTGLGFAVANPAGWNGTLYLDDVSW